MSLDLTAGIHCALFGQMDIGPMIPSACVCTGFVIIPAALISWYWLIRRRRQPQCASHTAAVFAVAVTNSFFALWLIGAIDEWLFEPKIDDTGATGLVYSLPEVHQYVDAPPANGPPREVKPEEVTDPKVPRYTIQLAVGEMDEKREAMKSIWHHFRVNLVNSDVSVLADAPAGRWVSMEEWRRSRSSTQP
jgi:hypothetical protein